MPEFVRRLLTAGLAGLLMASPAWATPPAKASPPIPVTATSHPWNASDHRIAPLDLAALGYVEEEHLVRGLANVYDWTADGRARIKTADAPYVTRILIRRPKDPKRFSGVVWLNPNNPTLLADMDGLWMCCSAYLARQGDIAVNVTIKPIAAKALKTFDPQRYGEISFANPLPADQRCAIARVAGDPPDVNYLPDQEDGLVWDVITQIGRLLRDPAGPLKGYKVRGLYAYGYSQDAAYLRTYVNSFHTDAAVMGGKGPYDGFLLVGSTRNVRINQCSTRHPATPAKSDGVPVITMSTEMDYRSNFAGLPPAKDAWRPDADKPGDRYRHYDIAGVSHGGPFVFRNGPDAADLARIKTDAPMAFGMTQAVAKDVAAGIPVTEPNQYLVITAMMHNLDRWAREGRAPAPGVRFVTAPNGESATFDRFGNADTGVRLPALSVPTAAHRYRGTQGALSYAKSVYEPFDAATLKTLYPTHADYVAKVKAAADRLVADGFLLRPDADALVAQAGRAAVP